MYCNHCGKEISDETVFCSNCGASVKGLSQQLPDTPPKGNGMAVAGFVCSFFVPILGWIFGGIGLSRAQKRNGKGKGFSIAAIAIASANFVLGLCMY